MRKIWTEEDILRAILSTPADMEDPLMIFGIEGPTLREMDLFFLRYGHRQTAAEIRERYFEDADEAKKRWVKP